MFVIGGLVALSLRHVAVDAFQVGRPWPLVRSQLVQRLHLHATSVTTAPPPPAHEAFAKLVSRGWRHYNLTLTAPDGTVDFAQHPPSPNQLTKYTIASADDKVEVWVLPEAAGIQSWLHNNDAKQRDTLFPNVLVHRCDAVSLTREDECLQKLLQGRAAICIGLPGIGMSVGTTPMLVKALDTIVQRQRTLPGELRPDGFEEVYYRVGEALYKFTWNTTEQALRCEALPKTALGRDYSSRYERDEGPKRCLLRDDLGDDELDPHDFAYFTAPAIPRLSRDLYTFKSLEKGGQPKFLIEPPSALALRVMYLGARAFSSRPLPSHLDTIEKFEALQAVIGPVPRVLFHPSETHVARYLQQRAAAAALDPWRDVDHSEVRAHKVGSTFRYFAAPFIRTGATSSQFTSILFATDEERQRNRYGAWPSDQVKRFYQFRALSESCKLVLAAHVQSSTQVASFLREHDAMRLELVEAVLLHAAVAEGSPSSSSSATTASVSASTSASSANETEPWPERWRQENWLVYRDPAATAAATAVEAEAAAPPLTDLHRLRLLPNATTATATTMSNAITATDLLPRGHRIDTATCATHRPVWQLEEGVLYATEDGTTVPPGWELGRWWWSVNHTTQRLVGWQVASAAVTPSPRSPSPSPAQPVDCAAVDRLFDTFALDDELGQPYRLALVGVHDASWPHPTGLRFQDDDTGHAAESLTWWQHQTTTTPSNESSSSSSPSVVAAWPHARRMESYLLRIPAFNLPAFELPPVSPEAGIGTQRKAKRAPKQAATPKPKPKPKQKAL